MRILLTNDDGIDSPGIAALHGAPIKQLLDQLRQRYDYVLLDTPATKNSQTAALLGQLADGAIVVLHVGRTPVPAAQWACQTLQQSGCTVIGCVLNGQVD